MSITLNADDARRADAFSSLITESGKYIGVITRAEKLTSSTGTEGLGLSFKSDDGQIASYLDIYTVKSDGTKLSGHNLAQAILCCTKTRSADDGTITCDKWDPDERKMMPCKVPGYPVLMNKKIGLVLQKELSTYQDKDREKMIIVGVFQAETGLTASEILDGKTKPQKLEHLVKMVANNPVRDSRPRNTPAKTPAQATQAPSAAVDFNDEIPF